MSAFTCREASHTCADDHCTDKCHPTTLAEGVAMLRRQLETGEPAHGNGYALCYDSVRGFDIDVGGWSSWTSKDDGFCCSDGNYICWESAADAWKVLEYNEDLLATQRQSDSPDP